jgi:hypothetical protein
MAESPPATSASPMSIPSKQGGMFADASFVGSPKQLQGTPDSAPASQPASTSALPVRSSQPTCPAPGPSSPAIPAVNTRQHPSLVNPARQVRRVASGLFRAPERPRPSSREWTLFGQRLEDEGQLRTAETPTLKRRASRAVGLLSESQALESILSDGTTPPDHSRCPSPEANQSFPGLAISNNGNNRLSDDGPEPNYDSDDSDTFSHHSVHSQHATEPRNWFRLPTLTVMQKNILKCAVAYFLGSLFTFNSFLSGYMSNVTTGTGHPSPSGHMVATVCVASSFCACSTRRITHICSAVYFNPAKTAGGMVEADTYCLMGLAFAAFVCLSSTSSFWWFEVKPGWEWLADAIIIFWVGIGMSVVAWMKLWMDKVMVSAIIEATQLTRAL